MGKQTLIHPVPLSVLRGALEYCGWKFKTLKGRPVPNPERNAFYKITGLTPPNDAPRMDARAVKLAIQKCYMANIEVTLVRMDSNGKIDVWLTVHGKGKETDMTEHNADPVNIPF